MSLKLISEENNIQSKFLIRILEGKDCLVWSIIIFSDTSVTSSEGDVHQSCCYEVKETNNDDHDEKHESSSDLCNTTPSYMVGIWYRESQNIVFRQNFLFEKINGLTML